MVVLNFATPALDGHDVGSLALICLRGRALDGHVVVDRHNVERRLVVRCCA